MAGLDVLLFGGFQVVYNGRSVRAPASNYGRALLAYLAVEPERAHTRDSLASLLWPDTIDTAARNSLRQTLFKIHHELSSLGLPSPIVSLGSAEIQFDLSNGSSSDVREFLLELSACRAHHGGTLEGCNQCHAKLKRAVDLYQADFLAGFRLPNSEQFEEWALFKQEELHLQALSAAGALANYLESLGEWEQAGKYAMRQVALEPWREEAHRQVMRALAAGGNRGGALRQYETCCRILDTELGVEPAPETFALYENIRAGKWIAGSRPAHTPSTSAVHLPRATVKSRFSFVGRKHELESLEQDLKAIISGQGRAVFLAGDAGSGKTSLMREFAERAMDHHAAVLVVDGSGNAYTGTGDPYHLFREILEMLTCDVEAKLSYGLVSPEQARRLRDAFPTTVQSLVGLGDKLIDRLIPGTGLSRRAKASLSSRQGEEWLASLDMLVQQNASSGIKERQHQEIVFEQAARVLQDLSSHYPLVLLVDDLQWADEGSIALLFYLGRRLTASRVLIVGAYRPEEVAGRPADRRHPLEQVINELGRLYGRPNIDLERADGRSLVEALVDMEPNKLDVAFREKLFRHTDGHALFTVELLRGMREQGDLVRDDEGRWIEASETGWCRLPPRVEMVVGERISRLPGDLKSVLRVASVEGDEFTAEVVARALEADEQDVYRRLSGALSREHQLISACSLKRLDGQRVSRYRFRHHVFQQFLYDQLDEVERIHRHEAVASAFESLYGVGRPELALVLARHYEQAGMPDKTIDYLLQAGEKAERMSGYQEAIIHYSRGLSLVPGLPEGTERLEQEFRLQAALSAALLANRGWGAFERTEVCRRGFELSGQIGGPHYLQALYTLADFCRARGEHKESLALGEQMVDLAERSGDQEQLGLAYYTLGLTYFFLGNLEYALQHLIRASNFLLPSTVRSPAALGGPDVAVLCLSWLACVHSVLGQVERSESASRQSFARAKEIDHPLSIAFALLVGSHLSRALRGDYYALDGSAQELEQLVEEHRLAVMRPWVSIVGGIEQFYTKGMAEGIPLMRGGVDAWQAAGAETGVIVVLATLADAELKTGRTADALETISEAFQIMERTGERCLEAELMRLRGESLLASGSDEAECEAILHEALDTARGQNAKVWELRTAISLAHLWHLQGKTEAARRLLEDVSGSFTDGTRLRDIAAARQFCERLLSV